MTSRTKNLQEDLNRSSRSFYDTLKNPQEKSNKDLIKSRKRLPSTLRLINQRIRAKSRYEDLTNLTQQQQKEMLWQSKQELKKIKQDWSYAYYTGNNKKPHASKNFSIFQNKYLEQFPDNNSKYNIQFLERSLYGTNLKFPRSQSGQFKKPSKSLYSKHYQPIVEQKTKLNQDWQLRPSKFGKINLDYKRDQIINDYQLQANPFRTPKSNSLISKITKSQFY